MSLPLVKLPTEVVALSDGQSVTVRGLSFDETRAVGELDGDGAEVMRHVIAMATDSHVDEVYAWCASTPFPDVQAVADAARRLSRLDDLAGEASGAASSSANGTRSGSSSPNDSA